MKSLKKKRTVEIYKYIMLNTTLLQVVLRSRFVWLLTNVVKYISLLFMVWLGNSFSVFRELWKRFPILL